MAKVAQHLHFASRVHVKSSMVSGPKQSWEMEMADHNFKAFHQIIKYFVKENNYSRYRYLNQHSFQGLAYNIVAFSVNPSIFPL